jgi:hypothetical protein
MQAPLCSKGFYPVKLKQSNALQSLATRVEKPTNCTVVYNYVIEER